MEQERTNVNCPLWGTETCARLNMRACRGCPAEDKDPKECDEIREDMETLYSFLPEEGVHSLFAGEACVLCRGEQKGKRESYGLFDMGHFDPRQREKKLSLFRRKAFGFVIPLQFGACRDCRRRFQIISWLPMVITIVILGGTLLIAGRESVAEDLRMVWRGLPLLVMAAAAGLSYLLSKVITNLLRARFNRSTYMDLKDHPFVRKMISLDWENIVDGKYPQPVFTRSRLSYGVGTALPETAEAEEKNRPDGENLD